MSEFLVAVVEELFGAGPAAWLARTTRLRGEPMPEPGTFCLFRSRDQGVVCGVLRLLAPTSGGLMYAEIDQARQVWNWTDGVNTLMEMSNAGARTARISEPAALPFTMSGICGVYACTPDAERNLRQSRWDADYTYSDPPPSSGRRSART